jgi:hypothetical protein
MKPLTVGVVRLANVNFVLQSMFGILAFIYHEP